MRILVLFCQYSFVKNEIIYFDLSYLSYHFEVFLEIEENIFKKKSDEVHWMKHNISTIYIFFWINLFYLWKNLINTSLRVSAIIHVFIFVWKLIVFTTVKLTQCWLKLYFFLLLTIWKLYRFFLEYLTLYLYHLRIFLLYLLLFSLWLKFCQFQFNTIAVK